jgi:hypothetical protein
MNVLWKNPESAPVDGRLIDRLVDGELGEGERRQLLLQLESQPDGWRRCALAFLEGQSWRDALGSYAGAAADVSAKPLKLNPVRRRPLLRLAGVAAGFAAAFVLGWLLHVERPEMIARAPVVTPESTVAMDPTEPALPNATVKAEAPVLADAVSKRWEQRGYRAERQQRFVSMELRDGRKLHVPVEEVRLQYVGDRTY